jgi:hypothetical protein
LSFDEKLCLLGMKEGRFVVIFARKIDVRPIFSPVLNCTTQPASRKTEDGFHHGYDLQDTKAIADAVKVPVIASGGAGKLSHFYDAVKVGAAILLAASVFHFRTFSVREVKEYLRAMGVAVSL